MKNYLVKIRGGVEVDSYGKKAGKGALIAEEISNTLGTSQDQILFQPVICMDMGGGKSSVVSYENMSPTLTCTHYGEPIVAYTVENHPADSRVNIDDSGTCQTLTSRMGTGGGNVPLVMFKSKGEKND